MNVDKRGIIIGMAIGDGYVQVRNRLNKGKYHYESRNMRVLHGANQRAYCEWKAKRLGYALGGRQINVTKVKNGPGGKHDAYQFTASNPYFGQVRSWLYPDGKKWLSPKVLNMLTPEGIAIWYMDDGSARRNTNSKGFVSSVSTDIATMCSEREVDSIIDFFMSEYKIEFRKRFNKHVTPEHSFYIQANTAHSHSFINLISRYVPECMMYKLAHVAAVKSHECQAPVSKCKICGNPRYDNRRRGMCTKCYTRDLRKTQMDQG